MNHPWINGAGLIGLSFLSIGFAVFAAHLNYSFRDGDGDTRVTLRAGSDAADAYRIAATHGLSVVGVHTNRSTVIATGPAQALGATARDKALWFLWKTDAAAGCMGGGAGPGASPLILAAASSPQTGN